VYLGTAGGGINVFLNGGGGQGRGAEPVSESSLQYINPPQPGGQDKTTGPR